MFRMSGWPVVVADGTGAQVRRRNRLDAVVHANWDDGAALGCR
jgi:hypothetical protein